MQNKTTKKSKLFLNISLAALLVATVSSASIMMGCGCSFDTTEASATPDTTVIETRVVTGTEIVTEIVDVTGDDSNDSDDSSGGNSSNGNNSTNSTDSSDSNGDSDGNNSGDNSSDSDGGNNSGSSNSENKSSGSNSSSSGSSNKSNNSSNKSNGSSSNSSSSSGSNNSSSSSSKSSGSSSSNSGNSSTVLKIGGKSFNVGDTIICKFNIKTPDLIENFQGQITYDTKYLECTKAKFVGEAKGGSVLNSKSTPGIIKFNGSSGVDGYDYTDGGTLIEITYTVKAAGSTTPTDTWEIVRQLSESGKGKNYISNGKPSNGMTSSFSYSN